MKSVASILVCILLILTIENTVIAFTNEKTMGNEINTQEDVNSIMQQTQDLQQEELQNSLRISNPIKSDSYTISDDLLYIGRILPETSIEQFKKNFDIDASQIHIWDSNHTKEIKNGFIGTNMLVSFDNVDTEYTASVIGDLNGDGKANQLEISKMIKHIVGLKGYELTGINIISADISGDDKVNQIDVNLLIRYVVYGDLEIGELQRPEAPNMEIVSGELGENGWYIGNVSVKLNQSKNQVIDILKTTYEIEGQEEKEFQDGDIITIEEEGVYTIKCYTVGKNGIRSLANKQTVKIDKTAPESANLIAKLQDENGKNYEFGKPTNFSVYVKPEGGIDELSGIQEITLQATGANTVNTTNEAKVLLNAGSTTVTVTTKNGAGLTTTKSFEIIIDRKIYNPGTVEMKLNDENGEEYISGTWTNQNVYLKVKEVADCTTTYEVTGANTIPAGSSTPSVLTNEGISKIIVTNVDTAGNKEQMEFIVKIERQAPEIPTFNASGKKFLSESKWYVDDVQVGINVAEEESGSGIKGIEYEVISGENKQQGIINSGEILSITEEGIYTIYANSIDIAGNRSEKAKLEIYIDKTDPTAGTMNLYKQNENGEIYINNTWVNEDVYVEVVDGKDELSGHKSTTYIIQGQTDISKTTKPSLLTEQGSYQIIVTTTDEAGRTAIRSYVVNIDKEAPDIPKIEIIEGTKAEESNEWYNTDVLLKISQGERDNGGSGIQRTTYQITGQVNIDETTIVNGGTIPITEDGIYNIIVYSYDTAGNRSREGTTTIKLDKKAPEITNFAIEQIEGTKFNVVADIVEQTSGIQIYEIYVDGLLYKEIQTADLAIDCEVLDQSSSTHTVYIKVKDNAGNVTTSEEKQVDMGRLKIEEIEYIEFVINEFTQTKDEQPMQSGADFIVSDTSISENAKFIQVKSIEENTLGKLTGNIRLVRKNGEIVNEFKYYPENVNMQISQYSYGSGSTWTHEANSNILNTQLSNEIIQDGELNEATILLDTKKDSDNIFSISDKKITGTQTYTRLIIEQITSNSEKIPFKITQANE